MPLRLQRLATLNPLTYQMDALRALMLRGFRSTFGTAHDFAVQAVVFFGLVVVAGRLYPTILE